MKNEKSKLYIEYWLSAKNQFAYETENFTVDLHSLTDDKLTNFKIVSPEFLNSAPVIFNVIHPKHHTELRKIIAYLTELQRLQSGAWQRTIEEGQKQTEKIKQWLQRRSTDMTKR